MTRIENQKADAIARLAHDMRCAISTILMWEHVARLGGIDVHDNALAAIRACALDQAKLIDELVKSTVR